MGVLHNKSNLSRGLLLLGFMLGNLSVSSTQAAERLRDRVRENLPLLFPALARPVPPKAEERQPPKNTPPNVAQTKKDTVPNTTPPTGTAKKFREPVPTPPNSPTPTNTPTTNLAVKQAPVQATIPANPPPKLTTVAPTVAPIAVTSPAESSVATASAVAEKIAKTISPNSFPNEPLSQRKVVSVLVSEKNSTATPWKQLFNGKDLTNWESSKFGGDGEITVADESILLDIGSDMTGVTFRGDVPKLNYALEVEAQRLEGDDFFAGITFPVGESHMSLIPGGWGGGVFGLSSINQMDASENETTQARIFDNKKWYKFRIQVTETHIQVWVNDKREIDLETTGKKLSTRGEVESSKPLGISTWRAKSAIRSVKLRTLSPEEIAAVEKPAEKK